MKALIAAGGKGTRLRPMTHTINKHLFPIANKPMIFYALEKVAQAGITEVAININEGDKTMAQVLGDGKKWGVKITYLEQKGGALGLAHVVKNAGQWLGEDDLLFYLGDNIISGPIVSLVEKFEKEKLDCLLALSKVPDPERFGVPVFKNGRIVKVEEKPVKPKSNFAVTGIYVYSSKIMEAVGSIKPSPRGELEISDAHTYLIKKGFRVGSEEITGWWKDTGKPQDLLEGNSLVLARLEESVVPEKIAPTARLEGKVVIGAKTKIGENVLIRGPVVIGENCYLENTTIEPYTSIADNCQIIGSGVSHSIICAGSRLVDCPERVIDSLIGRDCSVSAPSLPKPEGWRFIIGDNSQIEY